MNKYSDIDPATLVQKRNRLKLPLSKIQQIQAYVSQKKAAFQTKSLFALPFNPFLPASTSINSSAPKSATSGQFAMPSYFKVFTMPTTKTTTKSTTKTTTTSTTTTTTKPTTSASIAARIVALDVQNRSLVKSLNWVDKGYVTPVKDQGLCGCCFAFSAIGSLEGQWFRKTGQLISLAEQQLVDCVYPGTGCEGGNMNDAYDYIAFSNGIQNGTTYPYDSYYGDQTFSCRYDAQKAVANDTGAVQLPSGDEVALLEALIANGPIASGIDASLDTFLK